MELCDAPPITAEKRTLLRNVYARALLYKFSPRKEQKELGQQLKSLSERVTYPRGLMEKTYVMLFDLIADWREVAKTTAPWERKKPADRLRQFRDAFSLMDQHKPRHFSDPQPTRIVYGSPSWQQAHMAGIHRLKDHDKFLISKHYIRHTETQVIAGIVHELGHILVLDYHMKQVFDMHDTGAAAGKNAAEIHKAKRDDPQTGEAFKKLSYEEKLMMDTDFIEAALTSVPDEHIISTAQGYGLAVDVMQADDKRFNWYNRSPEEAFVRTVEAYAALAFGQNAHDTQRVIQGCIRATACSRNYSHFMTARQFALYTEEVNPATSLTALITDLRP